MPKTQQLISELLIHTEQWRIKHNMLQYEMAEELGVSKEHYNKVIKHKTLPSIQLLMKIEEICYGER